MKISRVRVGAAGAVAVTAVLAGVTVSATAAAAPADGSPAPAHVEILSPRPGANTGSQGAFWMVDFNVTFPNGASGFSTPQLTGPGVHNNAAPLPGSFSTGQDEHLPGVVVLDSTTSQTLPGFSGPGTNLANLFNLTAVTDQTERTTKVQDTWIVGAPIAGADVDTAVTVAVVADLDRDGVYDDAPAVVPDADGNGRVDAYDLRKLGVASNIETVRFHLNGEATP